MHKWNDINAFVIGIPTQKLTLFNRTFHESLIALGVDPTGKLTTSFDTVVRIEIPAKATTVACPTVADPKPKGNKPKFGCSFATIGSSETDNITIHYKGTDTNGDVLGSEVFTTTQAIGKGLVIYPFRSFHILDKHSCISYVNSS